MPHTRQAGEFRWFTPTKAHLAMLRVPVPPGFRRVTGTCRLAGFAKPGSGSPCLPQIALAIQGDVGAVIAG